MKNLGKLLFSKNMMLIILSILTAIQGLQPDLLNNGQAFIYYIGYLVMGILFQDVIDKTEKQETEKKIERLEKQIAEINNKINKIVERGGYTL